MKYLEKLLEGVDVEWDRGKVTKTIRGKIDT